MRTRRVLFALQASEWISCVGQQVQVVDHTVHGQGEALTILVHWLAGNDLVDENQYRRDAAQTILTYPFVHQHARSQAK